MMDAVCSEIYIYGIYTAGMSSMRNVINTRARVGLRTHMNKLDTESDVSLSSSQRRPAGTTALIHAVNNGQYTFRTFTLFLFNMGSILYATTPQTRTVLGITRNVKL